MTRYRVEWSASPGFGAGPDDNATVHFAEQGVVHEEQRVMVTALASDLTGSFTLTFDGQVRCCDDPKLPSSFMKTSGFALCVWEAEC